MRERELPFRQHLEELRRRLTISVAAILVTTAVAFVFHERILDVLIRPAEGFGSDGGKPIYTEVTEFLGITMKVSLLAGVVGALPVVLYQVVMFVAPGLTSRERRYLFLLLPASLLAFAAGAAFGYFVLFPPMVSFLLSFGSDVATPMIKIGNYINLMVSLLFWMGVIFETPLVLFFLAKIGVVTPRFLARQRRYAIVVAFILGAMITPTLDPINQSLVALPIIVMYELGIWLAKLAYLGRTATSKDLSKSPAQS